MRRLVNTYDIKFVRLDQRMKDYPARKRTQFASNLEGVESVHVYFETQDFQLAECILYSRRESEHYQLQKVIDLLAALQTWFRNRSKYRAAFQGITGS